MNILAKAERLARAKQMAADGTARRIRLANRLAQRDIGLAVGVDTSTVARWENGTRVPRGDAAWRYADLLARLEQKAGPTDA